MNERIEFVDYQEALSIKVGKWLLQKGFGLASPTGLALCPSSLGATDSFGILWRNPDTKPRKHLFGLIKRDPRREFIGTIWFSNIVRGASKQEWVFEAYGRKHIKLVKQLAEEMVLDFNVKIFLNLVREQPDVEAYINDYGY